MWTEWWLWISVLEHHSSNTNRKLLISRLSTKYTCARATERRITNLLRFKSHGVIQTHGIQLYETLCIRFLLKASSVFFWVSFITSLGYWLKYLLKDLDNRPLWVRDKCNLTQFILGSSAVCRSGSVFLDGRYSRIELVWVWLQYLVLLL